MQSIHYEVSLHSATAHLFEVTCVISKPDPDGQIVSLAAWIPGSYLIRDFARHIVEISAATEHKGKRENIAIQKLDKHTWHCAPCNTPLRITYQVYAFDMSVRTAYFDTERAYFNGTSLFLKVHGADQANCEVKLNSATKPYKDWQVATSMPAVNIDKLGFGRYKASNYAELIDYPFEIGNLTVAEFKAAGVPHRIAISGKHKSDLKRICKDLKNLCEYHIKFFGVAPFKQYLFMLYAAGDNQYGGLEHSDSTSLICPRSWLPVKDETLDIENYQQFLGLCSHEYFHAWHVKRMRPQVFENPDLSSEAYTRLLWIFEGFTAYYDTLAVLRAGLLTREEYLKSLSKDITRYLRTPGRKLQRLDESSFDSWVKLYKPDENTPNTQISYYLKGSLVALALDLSLRIKDRSLDNVIHALWLRYQTNGTLLGEDEIDDLILASTGQNLSKLLDSTVRGTDDPQLKKLLGKFGIAYETKDKNPNVLRETLGLQLSGENETKLANVFTGSPAEQAGLAANDVLIAIDNIKVNAKNLKDIVAKKPDGAHLHTHFFRRDELMLTTIIKQTETEDYCNLALKPKLDNETAKRLKDWLG
jgi:predicted metalloprotease with PDZ domain